MFWISKKNTYICTRLHKQGTLAQMVEQWTENPCVPGSIPGGTTETQTEMFGFFCYIFIYELESIKNRK
jgi:hypothetical protein